MYIAICWRFVDLQNICLITNLLTVNWQQSTVYYEKWRCILLCIFVGVSCSIMNYIQFLREYFMRTLYHIKVVGCWKKIGSLSNMNTTSMAIEASGASDGQVQIVDTNPQGKILPWSHSRLPYVKGSVVSYKEDVYVALGDQNAGYPGKTTDLMMFMLFRRPERTHTIAIYVQGAMTLAQLLLLQTWSVWDVAVITLLFNYYILWELVVLWLQHRNIMARMFHSSTVGSSYTSVGTE